MTRTNIEIEGTGWDLPDGALDDAVESV